MQVSLIKYYMITQYTIKFLFQFYFKTRSPSIIIQNETIKFDESLIVYRLYRIKPSSDVIR